MWVSGYGEYWNSGQVRDQKTWHCRLDCNTANLPVCIMPCQIHQRGWMMKNYLFQSNNGAIIINQSFFCCCYCCSLHNRNIGWKIIELGKQAKTSALAKWQNTLLIVSYIFGNWPISNGMLNLMWCCFWFTVLFNIEKRFWFVWRGWNGEITYPNKKNCNIRTKMLSCFHSNRRIETVTEQIEISFVTFVFREIENGILLKHHRLWYFE